MISRRQIRQVASDVSRPAAGSEDRLSVPAGRGWIGVARRVKVDMKKNHTSLLAAGVAFKSLLALFPSIVAVVSIWGLAASPQQVTAQIGGFTSALPVEAANLLQSQMRDVAAGNSGAISMALVASLLVALWSASGGMTGLMEGCTAAYGEVDTRTFPIKRGIALLLTFGAMLFLLASLAVIVVLPAAMDNWGLQSETKAVIRVGKWPMLAIMVMAALAVVYKYAPDRERRHLRWATVGAVAATVLWLAGSAAFTLYVENFGRFGQTYGSFAGIIVLMLWLYLTAYAVLLGAEINAEMERRPRR